MQVLVVYVRSACGPQPPNCKQGWPLTATIPGQMQWRQPRQHVMALVRHRRGSESKSFVSRYEPLARCGSLRPRELSSVLLLARGPAII